MAGRIGEYTVGAARDLETAAGKADLAERTLQESIRAHRESAANTRRSQGITMRGQDKTDARARAEAKGKPKFTTVQLRDARAQFAKAQTFARTSKRLRGPDGRRFGNAAVIAISGKGVPEPIARAAVQMVLFGGVRPGTRRLVSVTTGSSRR